MTGQYVHVDLPAPEARKAIGEEIAHYSWHILGLKSTMNALAPISILPPEILCEIFLYAADVDIHEQYVVKERRKSYGWICVSHVCRHWRTVALSCPALWSRLDVKAGSPELLEAFLARSRGVPLTVSYTGRVRGSHLTLPWSEQEAIAMVLESHLQRTRSLSLTLGDGEQNTILTTLNGPSPLLKSLEIRCDTSYAVSHDAYTRVHELLHHPETRVRSLKLHHFAMRWPKVRLPHLTQLNITGGQSPVSPREDLRHLTVALASMEALEELVLDSAVTLPLDSALSDVTTPVVLPRLRTLCLRDSASECIHVLNRFTTPSLSSLGLEVHAHMDPGSLYSQVVAAIVTKTRSMQTFLALAINFSSNYPNQARVSAYTKADPGAVVQSTFPTVFRPDQASLDVSFRAMESGRDQPIAELCRLLPVGEVRSLYMTGEKISESLWTTVLSRLHKVTALHAHGSAAIGDVLPDMLLRKRSGSHQDMDGGAEEHNHPYILPRLHTLALASYYFAIRDPRELSSRESDDEDSGHGERGGLVERFVKCLAERSEHGASIEELCISRPINITGEEIDKLEKTVAVFKWDGQLDFYDYFDDEEETDLDSEEDVDDEDNSEDEDNYSVTSADILGSDGGYYGFY